MYPRTIGSETNTLPKQHTPLLAAGLLILSTLSCALIEPASKYPDMLADADPVSAGIIEAEFDRMFSSKLNKVPIEVIFYPRLNAAALEFRHELIRYRQFWDLPARTALAAALEGYKADYEAKLLINRYNKTRSVYGKVQSRAEWETFKFTTTHLAYPSIELGYRFRNDAPFFATFMRSTREEALSGDSSHLGESQQIIMYFTRAQAEDMVKMFDQAYLVGLLNLQPSVPEPEDGGQESAADPYTEFAE